MQKRNNLDIGHTLSGGGFDWAISNFSLHASIHVGNAVIGTANTIVHLRGNDTLRNTRKQRGEYFITKARLIIITDRIHIVHTEAGLVQN